MSILLYKISKLSNNKCILDRVSLYLPKGALAALLGPSGSGKSSLLRVIAGLDLPSKGSLWLNGRDATKIPIQYRNMGFVFQNFSLFKHMNVRENISFGLELRNISKSSIEKRVTYLLGALHISDISSQYPHQISGGQKQRVALARSLAIEPDFLLLDEPFKALDNQLRTYLSKWLRDYVKTKGITTLMVTHDPQEAILIADEILVFQQGHLVQQGEPKFIYDHPINTFVAQFFGPLIELPKQIQSDFSISNTSLNTVQSVFPWLEKVYCVCIDKSAYFLRPYEFHLQNGFDLEALIVHISSITYRKKVIEIELEISSLFVKFKIQIGYTFFREWNIDFLDNIMYLKPRLKVLQTNDKIV